ncbi:MAG: BolA family transcriptional regulator [Pseudomonadota bacterium]|nr:BolA family transcriptional regulator [Pseudomonadota bacterium]
MNDRLQRIEARLREALSPDDLQVIDDSAAHAGHTGARSGGGHFNVLIVARAFAGKSPLQRHRMVYAALAGLMPADIHALSIRALTPEEL